jgi:gas vesicle protein
MESSNANKLLLMGLIGFAAGVLFAPDKGTITRDKIKNRADDLADKAKEKRNQAKDKMHELRRKKDGVMADMRNSDVDESVERLVP